MSQEKASRRRWLPRMNLVSLLTLVAIVGASAGCYAYSIRVQRQTVAAIKAAGGWVMYDWEWETRMSTIRGGGIGALTGWRRKIADRLGYDAIASVVSVRLPAGMGQGNSIADYQIELIGRLKSLRLLDLTGDLVSVTEAGAAPIEGLTQLEELRIRGDAQAGSSLSPIVTRLGKLTNLKTISIEAHPANASDLAHLTGLSGLEHLGIRLSDESITDAVLESVARLARLQSLSLNRGRITDESLKHLQSMEHLRHLAISNSCIDDLSPILRLSNLESLTISDIKLDGTASLPAPPSAKLASLTLKGEWVTDELLAQFRAFPKLEYLHLDGASVTDAGLESLAKINEFLSIHFKDCRVTKARLADFRMAHPAIRIWD
jgi:hypothetical protein